VLSSGARLGHYEVLSFLGAGGMDSPPFVNRKDGLEGSMSGAVTRRTRRDVNGRKGFGGGASPSRC
jgi:hypothetical protein